MTSSLLVPGVENQIDRIFDYIARDNPGAAQQVIDRIYAVIELVTERPRIGRKMRERGVRMYVVKPYPYIVFYRYAARSDTVRILRVRHGAMRRGALQDEPTEFRLAATS